MYLHNVGWRHHYHAASGTTEARAKNFVFGFLTSESRPLIWCLFWSPVSFRAPEYAFWITFGLKLGQRCAESADRWGLASLWTKPMRPPRAYFQSHCIYFRLILSLNILVCYFAIFLKSPIGSSAVAAKLRSSGSISWELKISDSPQCTCLGSVWVLCGPHHIAVARCQHAFGWISSDLEHLVQLVLGSGMCLLPDESLLPSIPGSYFVYPASGEVPGLERTQQGPPFQQHVSPN